MWLPLFTGVVKGLFSQKPDEHGTLTSTYVLNKDYSIASGEIFTVPPGVTLVTSYNITIQSDGKLIILGTIINNKTITNNTGGNIKTLYYGKIINGDSNLDATITNSGNRGDKRWGDNQCRERWGDNQCRENRGYRIHCE